MRPIQIILFIIGFIIFSCSTQVTRVDRNKQPDKEIVHPDEWKVKSINIDSFLLDPFDLHAFKDQKNGSNWGIINFDEYYFRPNFKSDGYKFFMFEPKEVNYTSGGRKVRHCKVGYTGRNKSYTTFLEDGLIIKTLRPSTNQYTFSDTSEMLIELTAKYNDFDLPEMAFVGIDSTTIINVFGKESFYTKDCLVYGIDNTVFILHLKNGIVNWLKFVRLSKQIKNASEVNELFELN